MWERIKGHSSTLRNITHDQKAKKYREGVQTMVAVRRVASLGKNFLLNNKLDFCLLKF
jgi:hypothetical protein